jgi:hypothetical protein
MTLEEGAVSYDLGDGTGETPHNPRVMPRLYTPSVLLATQL